MKFNFNTFTTLILLHLAAFGNLSAQFTFTGTGNYTDEARWSPSYPGTVFPSAATFINGNCTVTESIFFTQDLTVSSGATLTQDVGSGQIAASGSNIIVDGNVILKVEDCLLRVISDGQLTINGDISGVGVISSSLPTILGTGSLSPGNPGSVKGELWMGVNCDLRNKSLNIQLFGEQDNDVLNLRSVETESFLDGTLNVTLEGGYMPEIGHSFVIINSSPVINQESHGNDTDFTGKSFSTLNLPTLPVDRQWALDYSATGVVLSVEDSGLPVTLSSFNGFREGSSNVLKWSTAAEMQNSHFEIERSDNGTYFELIGRLYGAGTTSSTRTYVFTDQTFRSELSYYRLRQVDLDGSADYSGIISVKNSPQLAGRLYPNPVDDVLFSDLSANVLDYTISDANGKIIQSGRWKNKRGISTAELSPGIYFLRSGGDALRFVKK